MDPQLAVIAKLLAAIASELARSNEIADGVTGGKREYRVNFNGTAAFIAQADSVGSIREEEL